MSTIDDAVRWPTPPVVRALDVAAKVFLVWLLAVALVYPEIGNMEDKAAGARAVAYPLLAFTVPFIWWYRWRERASFPWVADLLVTATCFTATLGNRMDLYDRIVWFDDWMHFMNTGVLTGAVILLTKQHAATVMETLERGVAFGVTAAVAWEIAEYFAFISTSPERMSAYADTLGDIALGGLGAVTAALCVHWCWRQGWLHTAAPQLAGLDRSDRALPVLPARE